jgi:hypothetical protein
MIPIGCGILEEFVSRKVLGCFIIYKEIIAFRTKPTPWLNLTIKIIESEGKVWLLEKTTNTGSSLNSTTPGKYFLNYQRSHKETAVFAIRAENIGR